MVPTWDSMGVSLKHKPLCWITTGSQENIQDRPVHGLSRFPLPVRVQRGANAHSGDTAPLSETPSLMQTDASPQ